MREADDVYINRLLETSPLYHVLVRAAECLLLRDYDLPSPVLDIGCGPALITMPSEHFLAYYGGSQLLEGLRLKAPAARHRAWTRKRARVHHDDPPDVWIDPGPEDEGAFLLFNCVRDA